MKTSTSAKDRSSDSPRAPRSITPYSTLTSKRNNNQEDLEEDSLATDRLTKNPNLDLTQVPEPKQTTTNQPYTSFSFSSSSIPFEPVIPTSSQPKNKDFLDPTKPKLREAYAYAKTNLLMTRSQLDCYHHYLPGNGTFDIKTRATIAIRHDRLNHANAAGYQIRSSQGPLESFEREYLDLIRSAFLKYQFQARIGQMDGIFVAYHNTQRVFGFEYLPMSKMDQALFGNSQEGDKVFKLCLGYMERILEDATQAYPEQSLRITTSAKSHGNLWVFVSPDTGENAGREPPSEYVTFHYKNYNYLDGEIVEDNYIDIESTHQARVVRERGLEDKEFGVMSSSDDREKIDWSIFCQTFKYLNRTEELDQLYRSIRKIQFAISQLVLPEGVDRQLMRIVNWPETANELLDENPSSSSSLDINRNDSLTPSTSSPSSSSSIPLGNHTFVPTPGVKYKTEIVNLLSPDRPAISTTNSDSRSDWQNHLLAQERQRQLKAIDILTSNSDLNKSN
ncbi:hypothetical protein Pst134EA_032855 [Puccinia striiformis f. sp. tritici]|uniref:uncharacterized protein n=1 Tax=Puccinia striiformis f. sp. tritici TaxID=168172 RepID=UPI002008CE1A|nr:uncharacterized protein Pst134EA_032855 [Puccinia striiformis f. sp. tritici]KAH9443502.1 hypothetical protein Pst134EA_032855 [Puccinia striiformis f. sp. tritici]